MSYAGAEEEVLGKAYDARLMRWLWQFIAPYKGMVALSIGMVVPLFVIDLAPAWIVKFGLDQAFAPDREGEVVAFGSLLRAPQGMDPLIWLVLLFVGVTLLNVTLQFVNMIVMSTTGQLAMRDLRKYVFAHLESLHIGYFDRIPVGRLVTRVTNDVENVAEMFSAGIVALVGDLAKMIGIAVMLFMLDAKLALATFSVVPVLVVAAVVFRLKIREAFRVVRVRVAAINAQIQETITGMKVVQLFTREARNFRDFDRVNASHRDAWKRSIHYDAMLFAAVEAAGEITVAIIVWKGTGLAEAGTLYVFIDWMRRFFMPLRDLSAKYSVMQSSMASTERISELLQTEPAVKDPEPSEVTLPDAAAASGARGSVEFQNVWFAYQDEDWIVEDLSFRVEPGEKVAFVGATGAGKTTIIKLLTRLYDVDRGRVLVDGIDVRDLPQSVLRRRVATVLQDVVLFSGSIADNIDLGRVDIDDASVRSAARSVEADRFIERLPQGYQTQVRERGSNLSTGQRQLLSFARALAHGADILVLDEATSSIDSETERLVQRGIHALMQGRTAIAIAHRLSTIRDVDRIHVVDRGKLVESGSHEELLALDGVYAALHRLQVSPENGAGLEPALAPG